MSLLDPEWSEPPEPRPDQTFDENDRVVIVKKPFYDKPGYVWASRLSRNFADPSQSSWLYGICLDELPEDCEAEQNLVWVRPEDVIKLYTDGDMDHAHDEIGSDLGNYEAASSYANAEHLHEKYGDEVMALANFGDYWSDGDMTVKEPGGIRIPRGWIETDDGGRAPSVESYFSIDSLIDQMTGELLKKTGDKYEKLVKSDVEEFLHKEYPSWKGDYYDVAWGVSGNVTYYAPKRLVEKLRR
jgi:hypothetical protein